MKAMKEDETEYIVDSSAILNGFVFNPNAFVKNYVEIN